MKYILGLVFALSACLAQNICAQVTTFNKFIWATVDNATGLVTVLIPPGRISLDASLSYYDKSFFTCQSGTSNYTNNDVLAPFPSSAKHLYDGTTVKIADTVRTTWADRNGVDIIQDVYPVAFTKSGQIVYKWKIFNHSNAFVPTACQYLQDIQITDPFDRPQPNSNDGPIILTRWTYKPAWETFPSPSQPMPWFYAGFLHNIPNAPSFNPGLSCMGYLDYGAPLNLIKPQSVTIGDWYTLASSIFGGQWPGNGTSYGSGNPDNAVLVVFPSTRAAVGETVEIGRTSYGTGEYEECVGQLFSLVFYPHRILWTPSNTIPPGFSSPDSIHIEKFVVDEDRNNPSANTKIDLTVNNELFITDSLGKKNISRSQIQPTSGPGLFIPGGGVGYFDWYVRADSIKNCNGTIYDTLKFTGTCGICPPAFINSLGNDECDLPIIIDCAQSDVDAPQFIITKDVHLHFDTITVNDGRITDLGLKSITWAALKGTDTSKFAVTSSLPDILPCNGDKSIHSVLVRQLDSTAGGCFNFTFTDCVGHQSFSTICFSALKDIFRDSLPPITSFLPDKKVAGKWNASVQDSRQKDKGIDTIEVISNTNATALIGSFPNCTPNYSFVVTVADTTKEASICLRVIDCAGNISDTCLGYKPAVPAGITDANSSQFTLDANHPNPFSHVTTFNYSTAEYGQVHLYLYDELGRELARIVDDTQTVGSHLINFDGSTLASGNYVVRLESGGRVVSRRVVVER